MLVDDGTSAFTPPTTPHASRRKHPTGRGSREPLPTRFASGHNKVGQNNMIAIDRDSEWLEADGLGGFASGTSSGVRTRRYHALLLAATAPPAGRVVLVNGFEAWVDAPDGTVPITTQHYVPNVDHPHGWQRIRGFGIEPWPFWLFDLGNGRMLRQEVMVPRGLPLTVVSWSVEGASGGATLSVRPLLSGRDFHALHHENPAFRFRTEREEGLLRWQPYDGVPAVLGATNADFRDGGEWYRQFLYERERDRGLDCVEDLASPGLLRFDLSRGEALWVMAMESDATRRLLSRPVTKLVAELRARERTRRTASRSRLHRAADAYFAKRGEGSTILAGFPWFGDWGRDAFVSLRGLCLSTGRFDDARRILLEWAAAVDGGLLPNRFPDKGSEPEYNSVDAALWYVIAVDAFLRATAGRPEAPSTEERARLDAAVLAIAEGFARGTRFGIRVDGDGLVAAGVPGVQLTWMDAKVGDRCITPRIGKPVEVQALWLNALAITGRLDPRWETLRRRAAASFAERYWNGEHGCLFDVIDADHRPGAVDASFRPNQIFAVGGLPEVLLPADRARAVVDAVEAQLCTPVGLRSLAPDEPAYVGHYSGGVASRDGAYHQGTVWPWLMGPFVEAWVRVRDNTPAAKREARRRFLEPLLMALDRGGLGHIAEIADGDPPHTLRGCPFQAWSVAEALRLDTDVLGA